MCGRSDYLKRKIVRAALVIKKTSWLQGGLHNELFYRGKAKTIIHYYRDEFLPLVVYKESRNGFFT